MAGALNSILGSSSSSGDWGGLCFAAILIIAWVIKAISGAIKEAARQSAQRAQRAGPPPMPMVGRPGSALQMRPMPNNRAKGKGGGRRAQVAAPLPPQPPPQLTTMTLPTAQLLGSVQQKTAPATGSRLPRAKRSQIAEAMRRRIIWSEVLGPPMALRDDERSI